MSSAQDQIILTAQELELQILSEHPLFVKFLHIAQLLLSKELGEIDTRSGMAASFVAIMLAAGLEESLRHDYSWQYIPEEYLPFVPRAKELLLEQARDMQQHLYEEAYGTENKQ